MIKLTINFNVSYIVTMLGK